MGTFAEKAIVDYRLSFADQGKKLPFSVPVIHLQQTNESCRLLAKSRKREDTEMKTLRHGDVET
jgi:hypothetical protein